MLKGKIEEKHYPLNKVQLLVSGLPEIVITTTDDIEENLTVVTMPDRTKRSGGQTDAIEFTGMLPMHHEAQRLALDFWYKQGKDPVQDGYRKAGSLVFTRVDGRILPFEFTNLWISGRTVPGSDMSNDGEAAILTYKFQADEITPVP